MRPRTEYNDHYSTARGGRQGPRGDRQAPSFHRAARARGVPVAV